MPSDVRRLLPILLVMVAMLGATGCQRQMFPSSAVDSFPTADEELDFLDAVHRMTAVTNNDALHGLFLLADGADPSTDYEQRVVAAKERKWMPSGFNRPANESASVGWLSMAGCQIGSVRGGLTMHVLGPTPRYCARELIFLQIIPMRSENQSLTGAEFTDYLNRLQRLRAGQPVQLTVTPLTEGPAGEQAATPMNEADVEEGMPSPTPAPGAGEQPSPSSP